MSGEQSLNAIKGIKTLFKPYKGDLFGTGGDHSGGMLYLSRMNVDDNPKKKEEPAKKEARKQIEETASLESIESQSRQAKLLETKNLHLRDKRRRFAISLATLSSKASKRLQIVADGAIVTLVKLSRQSDRQTQLSCAAAFNSLAADRPIRPLLLAQGAVPAIVSLSLCPLRKIKNDCTRALCNLASSVGDEEEIVRQGAVGSLLAVSTSSVQLMEVVLMALLNLSCVDERYSRIDEVNDAVLHLSGFSMNGRMETMLVSCICNLTALKNNQARLVEEGCVRLLARICKLAPLHTQRLCAHAFCNLASCSRSRGKMTDQRVVPTLLELVQTNDEEVKRQCANTISRLAMDVACREKVVQQGAVAAIVEMCMQRSSNSVETDRVCAAALNTLSLDGDSSDKLVSEGAVPALLALIDGGDMIVRQDCAHCLCVLFQYEAGVSIMIDNGAVEALVKLADPTVAATSANCALALYNLLSHEVAAKIAGRGILPALIHLSHSNDELTKRTCAAALWELTKLHGSEPKELIPALIKMLRDEGSSQIKGDCAAALYNLAQDFDNCELMMKENCLGPLLSLVDSESFGTRVQCGAILSRLSFQKDYRGEMATSAFIRALFKLALLEPEPSELDSVTRVLKTQQRIVNAIYNLSCDPHARLLLLEEGAGKFLTFFQTKPAEHIRRGCAAALCNMLHDQGTEVSIMNCGAVSSLLITALVASDKEETKKICTKCLYNLLSEEKCHKPMVDEGVLWGFAALCKSSTDPNFLTDDIATTRMCSRAFCNLSCRFTPQLLGSTACTKTLLWLTAVEDIETQDFAARALLNVLSELSIANVHLANQSVKYLKMLGEGSNSHVKGFTVLSFCLISQFPTARREMMHQRVLSSIDFYTARTDAELSYAFAATMCNMAMEMETMRSVVDEGMIPHLLVLSLSTEERTALVVARTLYCCTCDTSILRKVTELGTVEGIQELLLSEALASNPLMQSYLSFSLFNLSTEGLNSLDIVNKNAVQTLRTLWEHGNAEIKRVCALATANLSGRVVNSAKVVGQQGTEMMVKLALTPNLTVSDGMRCVVALRNLLSTSSNHRPMLKEGVVDALVVLAASKDAFTSLNAAAALRTMTYNQATRQVLIEKNAINVIIDDTAGNLGGGGADDDDLKIANSLLQQIEAESWANGSRGVQREGRAEELEPHPLLIHLVEPIAVCIEVPMLYMGWDKVEHHTVMEDPILERGAKKSHANYIGAIDKNLGKGGGSPYSMKQKEAPSWQKGKEPEVDIKVPTKLCPKMECDIVVGHIDAADNNNNNSSSNNNNNGGSTAMLESSFLQTINGELAADGMGDTGMLSPEGMLLDGGSSPFSPASDFQQNRRRQMSASFDAGESFDNGSVESGDGGMVVRRDQRNSLDTISYSDNDDPSQLKNVDTLELDSLDDADGERSEGGQSSPLQLPAIVVVQVPIQQKKGDDAASSGAGKPKAEERHSMIGSAGAEKRLSSARPTKIGGIGIAPGGLAPKSRNPTLVGGGGGRPRQPTLLMKTPNERSYKDLTDRLSMFKDKPVGESE